MRTSTLGLRGTLRVSEELAHDLEVAARLLQHRRVRAVLEDNLTRAADAVEELGGGGSDRNIVGAVSVPVLDGLGAEGAGAHAPDEHVLLESIPLRARLLSLLLLHPGL
jgi:acetylornithine deacetylase/succinyl-diaminopimelate desuccinylase-like protein